MIDVWVSHKPPPSYPRFPYDGNIKYVERPRIVVGRSMSEANNVPREWLSHANRVDEIWLPSLFSKAAFVKAGFDPATLHIVPEAIDTNLFNPAVIAPPPLRFARLLARPSSPPVKRFLAVGKVFSSFLVSFILTLTIIIIKWEPRKAMELLLSAYFKAFDASQNVELLLHTYNYQVNLFVF